MVTVLLRSGVGELVVDCVTDEAPLAPLCVTLASLPLPVCVTVLPYPSQSD